MLKVVQKLFPCHANVSDLMLFFGDNEGPRSKNVILCQSNVTVKRY